MHNATPTLAPTPSPISEIPIDDAFRNLVCRRIDDMAEDAVKTNDEFVSAETASNIRFSQ